ncbi:hypothetical protein [Lysobacter claricitrinus]|uniref:hypothetical protein n=1 Tax=Lysobacter claricitrinus TaxID=3367728 RepID=UPI0037DAC86F
MLRIPALCLLCLTAWLPITAFAQSDSESTAPKWVSGQATDPTGVRTCSVYPIRQGAYPMIFFYGRESDGQLSIEGSNNTSIDLTLQVDANAELDGGFPMMSTKNTAALIRQIRADGHNLRLSQSAMFEGKLERFDLDLPLAGAVEQLDKCHDWLAGGKAKR